MNTEVEIIRYDLNCNYEEKVKLERRLKKIQDACKHIMELDSDVFNKTLGHNVRTYICTERGFEEQQHG